jgi:A/G-specific adenine glycosylase
VRRRLLAWYAVERRDFPWRGTTDPWAVLVSEVMLQQTQASRVALRFQPFMDRFPTPAAMVAAGDAAVLAAWSGLGYNRRAVALRRTAAAVVERGWPPDVAGLQQLPGVGPYTARALAALAFGLPVGAVDTNVRRWLVRRFGLPVGATPVVLQQLADRLAAPAPDAAEAAAWMHASMEFGARICGVRNPQCRACPIAVGCPSRNRAPRVPVARQPTFTGSDRAWRGAVLRALSAAPDHRAGSSALTRVIPAPHLERVLDALERDGLVHRTGGRVALGGSDRTTRPARRAQRPAVPTMQP